MLFFSVLLASLESAEAWNTVYHPLPSAHFHLKMLIWGAGKLLVSRSQLRRLSSSSLLPGC